MKIDLHIQFEEVTYESRMIKNVSCVPSVGDHIRTDRGLRRITKVVYDYTTDEVDVFLYTVEA